MTYQNPHRESEVEIEVHEQYHVVEITLRQGPRHRQNMWAAVLTDTEDEDWDYDRDFFEYLDVDEDDGTAKIPVGQGTVIEICEAGAADEPEETTWYAYNREDRELYEIEDEDELETAVKGRTEIFDSRRDGGE